MERDASKVSSIEKYLEDKRIYVEECLEGLWESEKCPETIYRAMRYSSLAGGKRLRPILAMSAAEMLGKPGEDIWEVACALELIHTYSLVHDDLPAMDDDDLRRGKPTCHRVFGEDMAILAGDALLTYSFELLSSYGRKNPEAGVRIIEEISRSAGPSGIIGGQVLDLQAEGIEVSLTHLEEIHRLKTGALIKAAIVSGALAAGASPGTLDRLERYALQAGLAFQVADDLLNVKGDPGKMGKSTGTDEKRGKATYPSLLGEEEARRRADSLYCSAVSELEYFGERSYLLRQLTRKLVYRSS